MYDRTLSEQERFDGGEGEGGRGSGCGIEGKVEGESASGVEKKTGKKATFEEGEGEGREEEREGWEEEGDGLFS